ncbi:GlxA family transcriptional regulator [Alteromonas lipolytica]|uniref:AraC family transcriptional regulator n=1 Tax=Alteromonas lipolytica TaxID=1856405 RepID=A0A1E8FAG9_9ALTE|nr:GlxA family transcriptional regulator [Alteromonas lipolytica]OFI32922.1 AraC family transcriptional regulator [Alteromonas lipolytica]GGF64197.1 AraC family transcriptional regulator [Alteromonas lipolytica]
MELVTAISNAKTKDIRHIGFVLLPHFTMMALTSAIEPLRMANQLSGRELYRWSLISRDGNPVTASDHMTVNVDHSYATDHAFDAVVVCGGVAIKETVSKADTNWLMSLDRKRITLGGICTGAYALAKAGLLDNVTCTIHWELLASWQEDFPKIKSTNQLYTIESHRWCSAGGTAPMDLFLSLIGRSFGKQLQMSICEMFSHKELRDESEMQRIPLQHLVGANQSKLQDIVRLMEANIEEPLSLDELATLVGLSRRQLERLFQKYLHCSPHRYYLQIRLTRARQLIKQTNISIIEVAICCGFVSTPHFSKCYRKAFNIPPREERLNRGLEAGNRSTDEATFGSVNISEFMPPSQMEAVRAS